MDRAGSSVRSRLGDYHTGHVAFLSLAALDGGGFAGWLLRDMPRRMQIYWLPGLSSGNLIL